MSQNTVTPKRIGTDAHFVVRLLDNNIPVAWDTTTIKQVCMYSTEQKAFAGHCSWAVDTSDNTKLNVLYPASEQLYTGNHRIVVRIQVQGDDATYDAFAIQFVSTLADVQNVNVSTNADAIDITVSEVDTTVMHEILANCQEATDAATAASVIAAADHVTASTDHVLAAADHVTAGSDHTAAASDHTQAGTDHTTAASDHVLAAADHVTAGSDHTAAAADHTLAGTDHTTAAADHVTAGSDHTRAEQDHQSLSEYYKKPASGIPSTDMTAAVQTSLGKADTALQEHQSLANCAKLDGNNEFTGKNVFSGIGNEFQDTVDFNEIFVNKIKASETDFSFIQKDSGDSNLQDDLDAINAAKANKPISELHIIAVAGWSALASQDPFAYSASVTIDEDLGTNDTLELINDNAVAFANYGFAIGAIDGQTATIYAIDVPTAAVTLKFNVIH